MVRAGGYLLHRPLPFRIGLDRDQPERLVMRILVDHAQVALLAFGAIFFGVRLAGGKG